MRGAFARGSVYARWSTTAVAIVVLASGSVARSESAGAPHVLARLAAWGRLHGDVQRNVRKYGADRVVVAVDFDNTTARIPTYVGSDSWYKEQLASGKDREAIHRELERIFATTPHVLIDPVAPEYLRKWQGLGVRVVLLTARSPSFHDVTRKEALRLGLDFRKTAPASPWDGRELPIGFREADGKVRTGRVSYQNGMVHCGDVDKGSVLRAFLESARLRPDAVVFADDRLHHLKQVDDAFDGSAIDLRLFHIDDGLEPTCAPALVAAAGR